MKKIAYRCLSVSLAFLLAINTAAAGRWLRACCSVPVSCQPAPCMVSCEPAPVCGGCEPTCCGMAEVVTEAIGCGCGETVVSSSTHVMSHEPAMTAEPTPAMPPAPTEVYEPAPTTAFDGGFRSDNAAPAETDPPSDDWDAGMDEPAEEMMAEELPPADDADAFGGFDEPAEVEEPADDLFADEPAMEEPPAEEPADDLFGDEPAEEAMTADDDLFGADEPAMEEPADDLFGDEPAVEDEPADDLFGAEPMEEPADEPMEGDDNLFGTDEPADDLFGDEPAAEEPAEEMSADDDLFGADADEPADDLFGAELAEEPADAADDDLFGGDDFDDGGFNEPAADEAPAEEMPAEDAPADDTEDAFDDLFGGFGAILREPGGVESARDRTWVDNTGRFSTVGRLIAIDGGSVRLMKQSGTVATVPLSRLSQGDLVFVSRQSLAQNRVQEAMIARGVRPAPDQPKQANNAAPLRTAQL
ncbi:MAG: SHD1 domain-containing protein [Planctomycetota bacterium]